MSDPKIEIKVSRLGETQQTFTGYPTGIFIYF